MEVSDLARSLKRLAKVPEAKLGGVACFFVKNGAIISSGINHNPTGGPMEELVDGELVTRTEVVHAEVAAIEAAKKNGVDLSGSTLLLTMSPCIKCAREVAKTGVSELCYVNEWWDKASLDILRGQGIEVRQIKEKK